jgi:hypothetical protein
MNPGQHVCRCESSSLHLLSIVTEESLCRVIPAIGRLSVGTSLPRRHGNLLGALLPLALVKGPDKVSLVMDGMQKQASPPLTFRASDSDTGDPADLLHFRWANGRQALVSLRRGWGCEDAEAGKACPCAAQVIN